MSIKYLSESNNKNKTVLVRGSVDAPIDEHTGAVADDFRIRSFLPTVELLLKNENKVIACGKLGRPKGKEVKELTLKPVAERLAHLLGFKFISTFLKIPKFNEPHVIFFTGDFREERNQKIINDIPVGHVVFLENLEFYQEELDNDVPFAKKLASLADMYVNDDFSKCHHPVASNLAVTEYLPSYAGLLLEKEIKSLEAVLKNVKHPFVVMTGGVKLSEKVGTLEHLGSKADKILVGGGVASLMFKVKGYEVGLSRIEDEQSKAAFQIEKNFKSTLMLPVDVVVANENMDLSSVRVTTPYEIGKKEAVFDIGPKTILAYANEIKKAKTIVWSGPLGFFEKKPFHHATMALARLIGGRGKGKAFVVAGGGDTEDAIRKAHQFEHIDHVSTGGGAMLEFLAGKKLPAIEALK